MKELTIAATVEKIGRKMIIRIILMCTALMTAYVLLILPLFPISFEGEASMFGVPLYQVLFMPVTAIEYFVVLLSMAEIYDIAISPIMLIMAVISILLLSIATPPIPGCGAAVLIILFSQFGIPAEAIAIAASMDIVLDFILTAGEIFCRQCELILLSSSLNLLDLNTLRKEKEKSNKRQ